MLPVIKAVMALMLLVAFVIPPKGLPSPKSAPVSDEGCPFCLVIEEDASCCEDSCCEPEKQEDPVMEAIASALNVRVLRRRPLF